MVQILLSITRVAVQIISEPEVYHGAGFILWAGAGVRVQQPLQISLEGRSTCLPAGRKAKSVTNNLPILSVLWLVDIFFTLVQC